MIVITTPTGDIGHQVVDRLLAAGAPVRVIARDPARLDAAVHDRVEVVTGSHGDPEVVDAAFAGAEAVLWIIPPDHTAASITALYSDFTRPACAAFVREGVQRVVGVSALGRGVSDHAGLVSASLAKDDLIAATGVPYRALVMPGFMDNTLRQVDAIRQGMFFSPLPADLRAPTCATRDIAEVAARWLTDTSWSGSEEVPVLGPEDLSNRDMVAIMSEVLGIEVRFEQVAMDAFRAQLTQGGMSPAAVDGMVDMMVAKAEGLDNHVARTPETATPTSFRQWCEEVLRPAVRA